MDKSWIRSKNRTSKAYLKGVEGFLEFAFTSNDTEKCPCKRCKNRYFKDKDEMRGHLIYNGFLWGYTYWNLHGEDPLALPQHPIEESDQNDEGGVEIDEQNDMVDMLLDALGNQNIDGNAGHGQIPSSEMFEGCDEETKKYVKLLQDAERPLYEGSTYTQLSFTVKVLNVKVMCNMTDKAITEILKLLCSAFPNARLAKSCYEAKKLTSDLGFSYETWDACKYNCMIFRNENKDLDRCKICQQPRYKPTEATSSIATRNKGKKIPFKQVRYFPLIPRLKRLFLSRHTAELMRWHASGERPNDGVMRHPADSAAWKSFDERYPDFASEARNVRLGLASDGFSPFGSMSIAHSTWPVVLIPYNLPPWFCMKQANFLLSILIDGPDGPGDKIDVYLQPLIEELKDLWFNGIDTYDVSKKEIFRLRVELMWTISDFPAYAMLSGWSTKGKFACPCCNKKTKSRWLKLGRKFCYLGHRRWLRRSHKFRRDKMAFDGTQEWDDPPKVLSGSELLDQLKDVETIYKEEDVVKKRKREALEKEQMKARNVAIRREKRKRSGQGKGQEKGMESDLVVKTKVDSWKKKSIFFELPYWEHHLIRHNLDVMHIEKNFCDNILYTLLGVENKSKDSLKARLDMKLMGIRKPLHPKDGASGTKKVPPASFTMSNIHKDIFLRVLKNIKVPDGYASNISRRVNLKNRTISGLKSHDNHILMQQLLPLAIRKALPKSVVKVLLEVSNFFRQLCSKVNRKTDLENIQERIILALCHLEKIFPPAFFDIMVHLPIHLAEEAIIAGPVQFRWMYPIERYLGTLKKYVRNRARPEGSIAQGYILEECMIFCGRYLKDVETKLNRPDRNDCGEDDVGHHFGKVEDFYLDSITREQVHRYILANTESIEHYREEHLAYLKMNMPRASDRQLHNNHSENFPTWFAEYVENMIANSENHHLSDEIIKLSAGPVALAKRSSGYLINGYKFRTRQSENSKTTRNSGVCLDADTRSYASTRDKNPISGDVTFYGELTDIIEINYTPERKYVLFKCDWVDNSRGKRKDEFDLESVNFNHVLYKENKRTDEPFIIASQALQVTYVADPIDPNWHVALKMTCRDTFDMGSNDDSVVPIPQVHPFSLQQLDENRIVIDDESTWVREGVEDTIVDARTAAAEYAKIDGSIGICDDDESEDIEED